MSLTNTKQTYSSKVRLGNWTEDQFGAELAAQPRQQVKHASVQQDSFPRHPQEAYTNRAQPNASRDSGLTFAEMFGHRGASSGKAHFQTSDPIAGKDRKSGAARKKAKQRNADRNVRRSCSTCNLPLLC